MLVTSKYLVLGAQARKKGVHLRRGILQSLKLLLGKMLGNLFPTLLAFATCPKAERRVQVSLSPRHALTICGLKLGCQFSTSGFENTTFQLSFVRRSDGRVIVEIWSQLGVF